MPARWPGRCARAWWPTPRRWSCAETAVIVGGEDLGRLAGTVAMVDGGFDPLHAGHLRYFAAAERLGLPLLCNVAGDAYVRTKHTPLLPEVQRVRLVDALRPIAYTHLNR